MLDNIKLENLKWIAVITMVLDHVNTYILQTIPVINAIGRVAFPLFVFLIIYRIIEKEDRSKRYIKKLIFWSVISEIVYQGMYLNSGYNFLEGGMSIMPTLLLLVVSIYAITYKKYIILILATLVAYILHKSFMGDSYYILLLGILFPMIKSVFMRIKGERLKGLFLMGIITILGAVFMPYNSLMILGIIPVLIAPKFNLKRISSTFFYGFYPFHLFLIYLISLNYSFN